LRLHALDVSKKEEYLGTDWRHVYSQKGQDHINSVVLPSTIVRGQWKGYLDVARRDGSVFYGDASLTKLDNGLILGVMRDVTERKTIEKEKEKLKDQMYMAQKIETITRLINGMGGDFRGTLSLIKDRAQHAILNEDIPEERRRHMLEIVTASEKAEDMLDRIMSFSSGRNTKAKEINAVDVVLSIGNYLTKMNMGRVRCSTDVRIDDAPVFVEKDQFEKVILGLCENAVEAIEHDGGVVTLYMDMADRMPLYIQDSFYKKDVTQTLLAAPVVKQGGRKKYLMSGFLSKEKTYIRLSVIDNGKGIASEIFANILDPFFTTKKRSAPAGLGLSYVHGFVLSAGGAFAVETEVGVGTSTHLFYPLCSAR
jgi:signal transduction histidine kinase